MAITLLSLSLLAASMFFITRPLWDKRLAVTVPITPVASGLEQQRSEVLMALNELETDYRTNKLSKEDYESLALPYRRIAMQWMDSSSSKAVAEPNNGEADALRKELEDEIEKALQKKVKETGPA